MTVRRRAAVLTVTGHTKIDAALRRISDPKSVNRIARKAITAGQRLVVSAIKREIPGSLKDAKAAIGSKFRRAKTGQVSARVGAAVGKKQEARTRRKSGGVGIGAANIHWAILGTGQRFTRKGYARGAMWDGQRSTGEVLKGKRTVSLRSTKNRTIRGAVRRGVAASRGAAEQAILRGLASGVVSLVKGRST